MLTVKPAQVARCVSALSGDAKRPGDLGVSNIPPTSVPAVVRGEAGRMLLEGITFVHTRLLILQVCSRGF